MHNPAVLRWLARVTVCLALLQAFVMAPYQHVHVGSGHGDHHESTFVHSHFYGVSVPINRRPGPTVEHSHEGHRSVALDTFTTFSQTAPVLIFQAEFSVRTFDPAQSDVWVEIIEPCGHDPPRVENTTPRAPPV